MRKFYFMANYEGVLARWIFDFPTGRHIPRRLAEIAMRLYGREIEIIRLNICPFCGRTFMSKRALYMHLMRSPGISKSSERRLRCYEGFQYMLREIIEEWMKGR